MRSLPLPDLRALRAFTMRELHAALLNRFIHVFSGIALAAGCVPVFTEAASADAGPYFLLQAILYLIPLFALLIGTGSAQSDQEERSFLFAQPGGRSASLLGKFAALWLLVSVASAALVLPGALGDIALAPLGFLWLHAVGAAGVFLALGLACGFATNDRVKAHLAALCLWFVFLAGFDLAALAIAHLPSVQRQPELWAGLLMLNPLDALRIGALFSIDRVPFDRSQAAPLVQWWLGNLGLWFAIVCAVWIGAAMAWSRRRIELLAP
jgi:ABC-type transport system involved in multi-copper enzyme maturation permease subunit